MPIYPLHNWLAPKITSGITKVSAHFILIHITDLPSRKAVLIYPLTGDTREEPLVGLPYFQTLPGHLHFLFCRLLMFPTCSFGVWLFATPWTVARQAPLPMDSPGQNTGVGCHALLPGIFPTQRWNPGPPSCRQILYRLNTREAPNKRVIRKKYGKAWLSLWTS